VVVGAAWSAADVEELKRLPVQRVVPVRLKKSAAYFRCLLGAVKGCSLQQSYVDSNALRRTLREVIGDFKPDLGYFNVIRTAQFHDEFDEVPCVIDLDEFRSAYYDLLAETSANPLWRLIARVESRRMREAEMRALEVFERVLVSSPTDLSKHDSKVRLVRSPHAIEVRRHNNKTSRVEGHIIFVGRQSYRANAEAIIWFAQQVMPEVRKRIPGSRLSIVGDAPPRSIRRLQGSSITVTGRVDDVGAYYASAAVSIIPVTMATGVQMKLIESMVMGTPIVATPIVARGAGIDGRHCYIARSADEWITRLVQVLEDQTVRDQASDAARKWVETEYSMASITSSLDQAIDGVFAPDEPGA
jgi:glycosyltransferase involved in cell wall biosynthesis